MQDKIERAIQASERGVAFRDIQVANGWTLADLIHATDCTVVTDDGHVSREVLARENIIPAWVEMIKGEG